MKKLLPTFLSLVLLLLACGCTQQSGTSSEGMPTPAPTETVAPAETPAPEPTSALPTSADYTIQTKDELLKITLPDQNWYQITSGENTEMFSDGDCAIIVNLYSSSDTLPTTVTSDADHDLVYTATVSVGKYIMQVVGYADSEEDFAGIGKAINSIVVDKTKITSDMLKHEIVIKEYGMIDTNYTAWVTANYLDVRSDSSNNGIIITTLTYGDKVTVTGTVIKNGSDIGWSRIQTEKGYVGYVSNQFLSTTQPSSMTRTGATVVMYTGSGSAVTLYQYSDNTWRDASGDKYWLTTSGNYVNSAGTILYVTDPASAPKPTGETFTCYNSEGTPVVLYFYSDGTWRDGSGITYWLTTSDTYVNEYGTVLYINQPSATPYRTGYTMTLYRSNGDVILVYEYSNGVWMDDSGISYSSYNMGQWQCNSTGEIFDLEPNY